MYKSGEDEKLRQERLLNSKTLFEKHQTSQMEVERLRKECEDAKTEAAKERTEATKAKEEMKQQQDAWDAWYGGEDWKEEKEIATSIAAKVPVLHVGSPPRHLLAWNH